MKKRLFIIFLILILSITSIHAEEESSKNTISSGVSAIYLGYPLFVLPGLNIEYERLLHKNFALAVDIGLDGILIPYMDLYARWYPFAGMFFANLGFGIWKRSFETWISMPVLSLGIGWKIDIGNPGKWNIITGLTGRIFFYEEQVPDFTNNSIEHNFIVNPPTGKIFVRVGYSF